jgi:hypothetical protein
VTGEVDRQRGAPEREHDAVPRVRVLTATVEEHDLGFALAPHDRADALAVGDLDVDAARGERDRAVEPELGRVLVQEPELVVWLGVDRGACDGHAMISRVRRSARAASS